MSKRDDKKPETTPQALPAHTQQFVLRRRELLRSAILGGLGYGALAGLKRAGMPGVKAFLKQAMQRPGYFAMDAAEIIADALRGGPSLLMISEALADGTSSGPGVFRVFYQTSHDIRNELCLVSNGSMYNPQNTLNFASTQSMLGGQIQPAPAPFTILNQWAYQLFTTGQITGNTPFPGITPGPALTSDQLANVSLIASIGLSGSAGIHQSGNVPNVGTLEYSMLQSYANYSPIGSVTINNTIIDSSGGVNNPGTDVRGFLGSVNVPGNYLSRASSNNPVFALDALTGYPQVSNVRSQMIDAYQLLKSQLTSIQAYGGQAGQPFTTYGSRAMEGLTAMQMYADLFKAGLANIGSTGMNSFDFHATDATRTPNGTVGNMLTETSQALAGLYYITQAAFAAKKDCIVYFMTCSNRSQDWVVDDNHVSTLTWVIKGSGSSSQFKNLPQQLVLIPDGAGQTYVEGPGNFTPNYSGQDAQTLGLTGSTPTVGSIESGIVQAAGNAIGQTPSMTLVSPAAKLTG